MTARQQELLRNNQPHDSCCNFRVASIKLECNFSQWPTTIHTQRPAASEEIRVRGSGAGQKARLMSCSSHDFHLTLPIN